MGTIEMFDVDLALAPVHSGAKVGGDEQVLSLNCAVGD